MSAEYMRGYAVTAALSNPPRGLITACGDESFDHRHTPHGDVVLYLVLPGMPDNVWDPTREGPPPAQGCTTTQIRRFPIPEPLQRRRNVVYGLEAKEIGAVEGKGPDAYVRFAYVITGSKGGPRTPFWLNFDYECRNDWHATSGVFSGKKLGRVGLTNGYQLDIDQTAIEVSAGGTELKIKSMRLFHDPRVESLDVAPALPGLPTRQLAVNGLWQRLACDGCDTLHYVNPNWQPPMRP